MTDTSKVLMPRPRGRPRSIEPSTPLSVRVKNSEYDRLVQLAHRRETSLPQLVRDLIKLRIR
jgi:predicted HicB family RNase H-like nuclease